MFWAASQQLLIIDDCCAAAAHFQHYILGPHCLHSGWNDHACTVAGPACWRDGLVYAHQNRLDFEQSLPYMIVISQHSRVEASTRKAERTPSRLPRNASLICLSLCATIRGNVHRAMLACQYVTEQIWALMQMRAHLNHSVNILCRLL